MVGGQATISGTGKTLTIDQSSNRAILNWQSFDIGSGEAVKIIEPTASSIELERITGGNPTQILGSLSANGQVWLVNPNGVFFGAGAQINVAGMVATTANISNKNFMAGNYVFDTPGNANASIVNEGNITVADAGLLAFVAPSVSNSGVITARLGKVALASGDTFTVDLYGDGLINLQASDQVTQQLVSNSGTINADGGIVMLTAGGGEKRGGRGGEQQRRHHGAEHRRGAKRRDHPLR